MAKAPARDRLRGAFDDADRYDRFMGRFSIQLAPQLAEFAGVLPGQTVLDVGCGPGALTGELARRVGPEAVTAIDPSEAFVEAARQRHAGVTVERGVSEQLPFPDDAFDVTLAQLVMGFMEDANAGLAEMARVTRSGGVIAICEWYQHRAVPHGPFVKEAWRLKRRRRAYWWRATWRWRAVRTTPANRLRMLGLGDVQRTELTACVRYERFDDWWTPIVDGVGPGAKLFGALDEQSRLTLQKRCLAELGPGPFAIDVVSPAARGVVR